MSSRLKEHVAAHLREEIERAGGTEVFAIGKVEGGAVVSATVVCRGQTDRVTALLGRPEPGQVVIHNHPSGDLRPSDADMRIAGLYAEDGIGFVIIDSAATRSNWVVEPFRKTAKHIDPARVDHIFDQKLGRSIPGWETRDAQRHMAHRVGAALSTGTHLVCEAGTGTGKSLAYLVPALLWAERNEATVVVATHTRALQGQLFRSDLKLLEQAGVKVEAAVLEGRGNYLCKRRLQIATAEQKLIPDEDDDHLEHLRAWSKTTEVGSRSDLTEPIPHATWEKVNSDGDLSLRNKCSHFQECHFYDARRTAAQARILVVNHALLLADLQLKGEGARGFLPAYSRVILDEAQHLEEVATSVATQELTLRAMQRAIGPILPRRKRSGSLRRLAHHLTKVPAIPPDVVDQVGAAVEAAVVQLKSFLADAEAILDVLLGELAPEQPTLRFTHETTQTDGWNQVILPSLRSLYSALTKACAALEAVTAPLTDHPLPEDRAQPMLDVDRARRKLSAATQTVRTVASVQQDEMCRWMQRHTRRDSVVVSLNAAPIDVAPTLRRVLWDSVESVVCTSATLRVDRSFAFWTRRVGLFKPDTAAFPSPFDYQRNALLLAPGDTPDPNSDAWLPHTARLIAQAVIASGGGAFVLCTSYRAVKAYTAALRSLLPPHRVILSQGTMGSTALLQRFLTTPDAVLVGTDSFWEGVSVKGDQLRLVIIPRLPFRVPSDPLRQARQEVIERAGYNPFVVFTLPEAILKLRQGFGRLIRSTTDTGAVILLDPRLHTRRYGAKVLRSLPDARTVRGSWDRCIQDLFSFYRGEPHERSQRLPDPTPRPPGLPAENPAG